MSLRTATFALALILGIAAGCGGDRKPAPTSPNEPKNAREKQLQEARASGEADPEGQPSWGKWRYTGDRNDCIYAVGRRCFKTEQAACRALKCKGGAKCETSGAGPVSVSCAK